MCERESIEASQSILNRKKARRILLTDRPTGRPTNTFLHTYTNTSLTFLSTSFVTLANLIDHQMRSVCMSLSVSVCLCVYVYASVKQANRQKQKKILLLLLQKHQHLSIEVLHSKLCNQKKIQREKKARQIGLFTVRPSIYLSNSSSCQIASA